jgi:hypothetical protein
MKRIEHLTSRQAVAVTCHYEIWRAIAEVACLGPVCDVNTETKIHLLREIN